MIVCAILFLALTDYHLTSLSVNAAQLYQTTANDVRGILNKPVYSSPELFLWRRSAEGKGCQLPSPLKNGLYTASPRRCSPQDPAPSCRMVPGTRVPEYWPIFYECDPGYILNTTVEGTVERRPSICRNGQWSPSLPACVESHYNSQNLPQFLSSSSYCGKPATNLTIKREVSGIVSRKGAWPWMAVFGMRKNSTQNGEIHWFCAGTLVTTRHILTAAHCITDYRSRNMFFARFNDIDLNSKSDDSGAIDIDIKRNNIVIHPGFKKERPSSNNIAIVKLNADLPITDFVRPICLPTPDFTGKSFDDETVYFSSWGQIDNDREWKKKRRFKPILREFKATVVNHANCNYNYRNYQSDEDIIINWNLICASVPSNQSCVSDAGSPLMLKVEDTYVLMGVVATPFGCFGDLFPRLFTRLSVYMGWIIANLNL